MYRLIHRKFKVNGEEIFTLRLVEKRKKWVDGGKVRLYKIVTSIWRPVQGQCFSFLDVTRTVILFFLWRPIVRVVVDCCGGCYWNQHFWLSTWSFFSRISLQMYSCWMWSRRRRSHWSISRDPFSYLLTCHQFTIYRMLLNYFEDVCLLDVVSGNWTLGVDVEERER